MIRLLSSRTTPAGLDLRISLVIDFAFVRAAVAWIIIIDMVKGRYLNLCVSRFIRLIFFSYLLKLHVVRGKQLTCWYTLQIEI